MDANSWALTLTVAVPFLGAAAILALRNRPNEREAASLVTAVITFLLAASALPALFASGGTLTPGLTILPGFAIRLHGDALGLLFATLASFLWILTTVYNVGYMRGLQEHAQARYYASFALVIGATMGVALSSNLFSLFIFYEILTVATYPLVVHKETAEAFAAGRKYLIYTLSGGVAVLAGTFLLAGMGASLDFVAGGAPSVATLAPQFARLAFLLLLAGFAVKAAVVPLHGWLPSAMIAPTPVSGLLHAVAVVKAGVFGILRLLLYLYGPDLVGNLGLQNIVIGAAVVTIVIGSLFALLQDDFKLRLAYSTVSQLSYIILGAAILLPGGMTGVSDAGRAAAVLGAGFAIAAHAFSKLAMFFVAGAVAVETGKTKISELDGLGRRMPWEFGAFTLAVLSMAGLPPMAGFVSKWYLSVGAWSTGDWWILLVFAASSVLNLAYFLPIIIRAFFPAYQGTGSGARPTLKLPILASAGCGLLFGLFPAIPYGPFAIAARMAADVTGTAMMSFGSLSTSLVIPPFLVFVIGGPLVLLLRGRARQAGLVIVAGLALLDVLFIPGGYLAGATQAGVSLWQVPFMGYTLTLLRVDALSYLAGTIFALITFLAVLYAATIDHPRLHLFALLYAGTSIGAVFAGDWISLLVFWELMAVTSTILIWQEGGEAVGAGFRYFLFHALGGALLGAGIALLIMSGGSPVVGPLAALGGSGVGSWGALFILLGIGVNICFIPLHTWLPDAYPRAHFAASVFLSVYTTKLAVYLLARAQPSTILVAYMGALMAVYGVSFAVLQNNMRRLLSYHIISQVGYMVAGVGLFCWLSGSSDVGLLGLNGGMAHVFNHILYKALLFMTVGVIIWKTGENLLSRVGGLWKKMPVTAVAFWIAAFSISGVPLFNGFVSKGMVILAAEETSPLLWALLEIASFGTFLSFLKLGYFAFHRPAKEDLPTASDPPLTAQIAMAGTAALCVAIGLYPPLLYAILPAPVTYTAYDPTQTLTTLAVLGAAALFFFTIGKKLLEPHDTGLVDFDAFYAAACRAVVDFSGVLWEIFGWVYRTVLDLAAGLIALGRRGMWGEGRDVNWNLLLFGVTLVVILFLATKGVGA
ncbi:MAG TPA: Na(+)/H(+) antiporter subunit D [Methanomicrobiales archaeon]|nr:Na(+)/H(+) antiporter subunit D [Methanomicrobiales archaeon]